MAAIELSPIPRRAVVLAYAQLLRLPNLFTAMADVLMGYSVTHESLADWPVLIALLLTSVSLYCSGMALNDYFDRRVDARQRPFRPIPSGRVPARHALLLGIGLMALGLVLGLIVSIWQADQWPAIIAVQLAASIWLYNAYAKRFALGPVILGCCRTLNVLMGMSLLTGSWHPLHHLIADGVGLYVVGVSFLAREEADESRRWPLALATAIMMTALAILHSYPWLVDADLAEVSHPTFAWGLGWRWHLLWGVLALMLLHRCVLAIVSRQPAAVQGAVKVSLLSLILIDAAICWGEAGSGEATLILILLLPTLVLGRWLYST